MLDLIKYSDGKDDIVIYIKDVKAKKILPPNCSVNADDMLIYRLKSVYGDNNVKVVEKTIEKNNRMN